MNAIDDDGMNTQWQKKNSFKNSRKMRERTQQPTVAEIFFFHEINFTKKLIFFFPELYFFREINFTKNFREISRKN